MSRMTTISLRTLVREPLKVKRMTRAGKSMQVTENGEPLCILQPAHGTDTDEAERRRAIDEILDEVLREKPSKIRTASVPSGALTKFTGRNSRQNPPARWSLF
jgi:hypothetical protein